MPPTRKLERRLVTLDMAASYLSCSVKTIRRMISEGEVAGFRVGKRMLRVDLNEIDAITRQVPTAERRPT